MKFPNAPIVNGNTEIGVEAGVKGRYFPVIILATEVIELQNVSVGSEGEQHLK